jgi:HSP20 family protein
MIRYSMHQLAIRHSGKVASTLAKPVATVLSGKISSGSLPFSTKVQRQDDADTLLQSKFADGFDERDSLEMDKKKEKFAAPDEKKVTTTTKSQDKKKQEKALQGRERFRSSKGPLFPALFAGFDDLFDQDLFAHPFFGARRREPFFFDSLMPVLRNLPVNPRATLLRSSPGYEIKESDVTYEIAIDIPDGIKASDMKVELENDGTVLHLSGGRKLEEKDKVSTTRFHKRFTIGPNVETDKITASLSDGVLVLTAPKIEKALETPKHQTIAITETPHRLPTDDEVLQMDYSDEADESDRVEMGKKKG